MYLIEIFLPLTDNDGARFPRSDFDAVRDELTARFGGVTAFLRAPAVGLWEDEGGNVRRDEIAIVEVMSDELERDWWDGYRRKLERRFLQDEIVVRATRIDRL